VTSNLPANPREEFNPPVPEGTIVDSLFSRRHLGDGDDGDEDIKKHPHHHQSPQKLKELPPASGKQVEITFHFQTLLPDRKDNINTKKVNS